ncbi:hypothetical protein [Ktedonobacter robiniae]|uniref:Uncharacterized protein n=1 Tax=Ktedonobacter robiniae TaxID=2778365 RepID=A0ABQ3UJL1_9CHLR|nr:hypothetical protein [Ktedonobacter robiniae]GHO52884.1 hypothetical protein KSB_13590 [Ktedonobacter robiniae]
MDELTSDNEFVSVTLLVPKHLVGAVYRAAADIVDGDSTPGVVIDALLHGDVRWWSKDKLAQLHREVTNPTVLALLGLTAEKAGNWVTYDEVCERSGRSGRQVQGDLAGLTQLIKRRFEHNTGFWPVEIRPSTQSAPYAYRMPVDIARRWKDVLQG